jgi:hypothetical protein
LEIRVVKVKSHGLTLELGCGYVKSRPAEIAKRLFDVIKMLVSETGG